MGDTVHGSTVNGNDARVPSGDPFAAVRATCARFSVASRGKQRAPAPTPTPTPTHMRALSGYGWYTQALWRLVAGMVHAGRLPGLFVKVLLRDGVAKAPAAGLYGLSPESMASASIVFAPALARAVAHGLVVQRKGVLHLPPEGEFLDRVTRASAGGLLKHLPGLNSLLGAATRGVRARRDVPTFVAPRVVCVVEDVRARAPVSLPVPVLGTTFVCGHALEPCEGADSEWEEA